MTTTFEYEILINVQPMEGDPYLRPAKHLRFGSYNPYQDEDALVRTFSGRMVAADAQAALWQIVARHNQDDRPDGQVGPSFSAGDVIRLWDGGPGLSSYWASIGHDLIAIERPANVEYSKSWVFIQEEQAEARKAAGTDTFA